MPSMTYTPISPRTIDRLVSALTSVKNNGGVITGPEPFMEFRPGSPTHDADERKILTLRHLKATRDALHAIVNTVEDGINALQSPCVALALERGIQSIPEDVLAHIFGVGYHSCDPPEFRPDSHIFSASVSQVSRHFRILALATPQIWTRLNNHMTISQLMTFLYRSKAADLIITAFSGINPNYPCTTSLKAFLAATLPHYRRWSEFSYEAISSSLEAMHPKSRHVTFPRLKSLGCQKLSGNDSDKRGVLPEKDFATWETPALTHFHADGFDPSTVGGAFGKHIKFVDLSLDESFEDHPAILQELGSWPHLTSLNVDFLHFNSVLEVSRVHLRSLKTLVIKVDIDVDGEQLGRVLSLLDMPVLTSMSLQICREMYGVDEVIEGACNATSQYRSLQEFTLDTNEDDEKMDDDHAHRYQPGVLGLFANRLPFLKQVTFRGAGLYEANSSREEPVTWQSCHFKGAASDDMDDINTFVFLTGLKQDFILRLGKCGQCKEISSLKERTTRCKNDFKPYSCRWNIHEKSFMEMVGLTGDCVLLFL